MRCCPTFRPSDLCYERGQPSSSPSPNPLSATWMPLAAETGGAERVDIQALLGHESIATTQIYTNVGQERMEQVVARL